MKKYAFLLLFVFAVAPLFAQHQGGISVERKILRREGGQLRMELEIRVAAKAVTRSQGWSIVPELSTTDRKSVKIFPHVEIDGPYQSHMRKRRRILSGSYWSERQPYAVVEAKRKTDRLITYKMEVPYEAWMDGATLVMRYVQVSPGNVRRVFTVDVNGAVDAQ